MNMIPFVTRGEMSLRIANRRKFKNEMPILNDSKKLNIIERIVCNHFGLNPLDIQIDTRDEFIRKPRQIIMYFSRIETRVSYENIGLRFGNRDHATVMHAYKVVNNEMIYNHQFKEEIKELHKKIKRNYE